MSPASQISPTSTTETSPLVSTAGKPTNTAIQYGTDDSSAVAITNGRTSAHCSNPAHHAKIGMLGSISIAVNSLTGPAMLNLPATFQRSGLIPTTVTLFFVCMLAALCSLHMADTISKFPGNTKFEKEVEFSESFRHFWGRRWFIFTEVVFYCCVTCLNISSIVDTAQVVDTVLGSFVPGGSHAIQFTLGSLDLVHWDPSECNKGQITEGDCNAFGNYDDKGILLTLGYIITGLIFFPMALMDLKENSTFQVVGFLVLLGSTVQFSLTFITSGLDMKNVSLWGESWDTLFGVILFNFALVIAVPAWLYERNPSVSVPAVIHTSCVLSTMMYLAVGALGALSIHNVSDNMLESMMLGDFGLGMQLGASLFAFMIIGLGIPLFSVLTRMNLTGSGLCSDRVGNTLAVYFPWSISWILYQGEAITQLLSWGGVIFTSAVAFLLPLFLALHTVLEFDDKGSIDVYYKGWFTSSRRSQVVALSVLLTLAIVSVIFAVIGQFFNGDDNYSLDKYQKHVPP